MPDFSEILKIAVEQQDWHLICGLYTNITGEPLSVPSSVVKEEEKEEGVLTKEYSIDELKHQSQLPPKEKDLGLIDKNIDKPTDSKYNEFTAPSKKDGGHSGSSQDGKRMRSEPIGGKSLSGNYVGINNEPFIDDMTESLLDPETGESLVGKNKDAKVTPRNRRKELGMNDTSLINVVCSVCNSEMKVSPVLSHGFSSNQSENSWKCNSCSTRKGRLNASRE